MNSNPNIFGSSGTYRHDIRDHFRDMKVEIVKVYEDGLIDSGGLIVSLGRVRELEMKLSHVCSEINMTREETIRIMDVGDC